MHITTMHQAQGRKLSKALTRQPFGISTSWDHICYTPYLSITSRSSIWQILLQCKHYWLHVIESEIHKGSIDYLRITNEDGSE
jgi:hypothetical protein